ncbi:hypothetical protein [Roseitranquillus sediminis]|uniref:hypothetical protein n=1 Tax=Roseitranquillus sediminis TaxID=2809051 RepID=UPI001D0C8275|nr:hypothetical protein [Roseitranquillus sediminis]MBM9594922.1 hypothetical protein [Roseitranquillus sediminis]
MPRRSAADRSFGVLLRKSIRQSRIETRVFSRLRSWLLTSDLSAASDRAASELVHSAPALLAALFKKILLNPASIAVDGLAT